MKWEVYLHPAGGGIAVAVLLYTAYLGLSLRARSVPRGLGRRHARAGIAALALIGGAWVFGLLSVGLWREDLGLYESQHFKLGTATLVLVSGSYFTSRAVIRGDARARDWHPWFGVLASLLAAAQIVTGLQLTP